MQDGGAEEVLVLGGLEVAEVGVSLLEAGASEADLEAGSETEEGVASSVLSSVRILRQRSVSEFRSQPSAHFL